MKRGTTPTLEIKLELNATNVTNVYFTFKEKVEDSNEFLLQKNYPEDATYDGENEVFLLPLTQEDTLALTDTYFLEAEVVLGGKSVIKSDIGKEIMQPTLYTKVIGGNESNGNNETITLSFTDYIKQEGGGSSDYNDLSHKPRFNGIEWVGNKTDSDMGIATKGELQTKSDKSDTYTKEETNTFLNAKQDTLADGNGVKIENDEISVDLQDSEDNQLDFTNNGQLRLSKYNLAHDSDFRTFLVDSYYNNPLASKSYVDDLMSGATKWEFVSQLPTEDIDIHTIYFVPKESAETDNIYDEWVYAIQSRNPDVYDWELLGTSQVDLTNYYTKTESDEQITTKTNRTWVGDTPNQYMQIDIRNFVGIKVGDHYLDRTNAYKEYVVIGITAGQNLADLKEVETTVVSSQSAPSSTAYNHRKLIIGTTWVDTTNNKVSILKDITGTSPNDNYVWVEVQNTITSSNKLNADLVDDTSSDNKFVTLTDIIAWNNKQEPISQNNKLDADLVDDTNTTNKFVSASEKSTWNGKADNTTISTDTTSTTVSLTLADNHEYRYTQDLTSLTLTMPSGDFISSIVFASGSTPTSMTYDSSIKWSGDDVTNGQFVPSADKDYDIMMYYNGLNVNGVVRGV